MSEARREIGERLRKANLAFARRYPGESGTRQPVHVVYGGAHLFKRDAAAKLGGLALRALDEYAPAPADLARVFDLSEALAGEVHTRVREKLRREPVEAYHADFEDGYGLRPDDEENAHAETLAREAAAAHAAGALPPFFGIRIKALAEETRERAMRTLDLFLNAWKREAGGPLPENFAVMLPKVVSEAQVAALARLLALYDPAIRMEIMIETPQALLALPGLAEAGRGRCAAAHFGAYDYTAALGISSHHQTMDHPACDFARQRMQAALAGTGVRIVDGATNVLPIPPYRAPNPDQVEENRAVVHRAWRLHFANVRRGLAAGFYQGWDLHPAQLVPRYAAVHAFFLEGIDEAAERLRNFVDKAARATRVREVFDDAATGQGLLNFFLRAVDCGAVAEEEALAQSGLTLEELRGKSFAKILAGR